jgi:hypothetical protein
MTSVADGNELAVVTAVDDGQLGAAALEVVPAEPPAVVQRALLVCLWLTARRARSAELEVEQLATRVRELETWVDERARFDDVEHLQIGRLLAAAEARRIERLAQPLVSIRTLLLLLYCAALALLAVLLLYQWVL